MVKILTEETHAKYRKIDPETAKSFGIHLLNCKEYEKFKDNIPKIKNCWWLYDGEYLVNQKGEICPEGYSERFSGLRPSLYYFDGFDTLNFSIGSKFIMEGHNWTVIDNKYAICDKIIRKCFETDIDRYLKDLKKSIMQPKPKYW